MNIVERLFGKKEKTMEAYFQQGDVVVTPIDTIPEAAKKLGHKTLAEGEATGHFHVAEAEDVEIFQVGDTLYMNAPTGTSIRHEEHKRISVKPGKYKIGRVREYDHLAMLGEERVRRVID